MISFEQFLGVLSSNPFLVIVMLLVMGTIFVNGATDAANESGAPAVSHESVLEAAGERAEDFERLVRGVLGLL